MATRGVIFHAPPANHSWENSGDICDTVRIYIIKCLRLRIKIAQVKYLLGVKSFIVCQKGDTMRAIEISDPRRVETNQRPVYRDLNQWEAGEGFIVLSLLLKVFVICEKGIYHPMPRIPVLVITVTHSLFGCDHLVTTGFIIAVLKKLRCLNCLSNVGYEVQLYNNDKAGSERQD